MSRPPREGDVNQRDGRQRPPPPAPGPKLRRATQATAGIVMIPHAIETKIAEESATPNTAYASPMRSGKPAGAYGITIGSSARDPPGHLHPEPDIA